LLPFAHRAGPNRTPATIISFAAELILLDSRVTYRSGHFDVTREFPYARFKQVSQHGRGLNLRLSAVDSQCRIGTGMSALL
jgi:hypothetical protein